MYIPRDYQTYAIQSIYRYFEDNKTGHPIVAMPTGCHGKGHGILLVDGSIKKVEDVKVGDKLMGPDSKAREVLALARGRQEMRRIVPIRGESFIVNLDHKLSVTKVKEGGRCQKDLERTETITIREYEEGSKWYKHVRKLRRVGVEFPAKDLPLDPYFLGLMLGDGCTANGQVCLTTKDEELAGYFEEIAANYCLNTRRSESSNSKAFSIFAFGIGGRNNENPITHKFRKMGLSGLRSWEKFIPFDYLTSSREQREALLAGLWDSDGYVDTKRKSVSAEYVTTSEQLAKDVLFLARSLGLGATCSEFVGKLYGVEKRTAWSISLSGDFTKLPFIRKKHKCLSWNGNRSPLVTAFEVEKLPEDDYFGFTLDGDHLYLDEFFNVHHNTGKSIVIGGFIHGVMYAFPNQRILMITHVKELVAQNLEKLKSMWPEAPVGVFSAGLGKKETHYPITFGGIDSIASKAHLFGHIDLVLVDECDLISPREESTYQKFFAELFAINPAMRIIGFTATPFRMGHGLITEDHIFTDFCCDLTETSSFNRFFEEGYLCKLVPKRTDLEINLDGIKKRGGEYVEKDLQFAFDKDEITQQALTEAEGWADATHRKCWLVFATGVKHGENIAAELNKRGVSAVMVSSKDTTAVRDKKIEDFKAGKYTAMVNNGVLTTGFDHPEIDMIVMLRASESSRLWVQMLGRGTRPFYAPGYDLSTREGRVEAILNSVKPNCLVLDFAGNSKRLGPINDPRIPAKKGKGTGEAPIKDCPNCYSLVHASARTCPDCGYVFPEVPKIKTTAGTADLIKGEKVAIVESFPVELISYTLHTKVGKPDSMKVTYRCGKNRTYTEYICIEHQGYAERKAMNWWREHSGGWIPNTTAQGLAETQSIMAATHIKVRIDGGYPEIIEHCFDGTNFGATPPSSAKVEQVHATPDIPFDAKKFDDYEDDIPF